MAPSAVSPVAHTNRLAGLKVSPLSEGIHPNDLAKAIGWFSIGLGLAEVCAPRALGRLTGVHHPSLLRAYGVREIATGVAILNEPSESKWMWGRVAGDALDLATLGCALEGVESEDRAKPAAAIAAVVGVTVLDVVCALQLSANEKSIGPPVQSHA